MFFKTINKHSVSLPFFYAAISLIFVFISTIFSLQFLPYISSHLSIMLLLGVFGFFISLTALYSKKRKAAIGGLIGTSFTLGFMISPQIFNLLHYASGKYILFWAMTTTILITLFMFVIAKIYKQYNKNPPLSGMTLSILALCLTSSAIFHVVFPTTKILTLVYCAISIVTFSIMLLHKIYYASDVGHENADIQLGAGIMLDIVNIFIACIELCLAGATSKETSLCDKIIMLFLLVPNLILTLFQIFDYRSYQATEINSENLDKGSQESICCFGSNSAGVGHVPSP